MSRRGSRGVGFRLLDGVIVGACALLLMKGLSFVDALAGARPPAEPDQLPAFGRVVAHARQNYVPADPSVTGSVPDKKEPAPAAAPPPSPAAAPPPPEPQVSPSERAILERLGDRREELQQRSRQMETRERVIQESEKRLEERLDALKAAEERKAAAASPAAAESAALKALVTMYETMKPKEAARVFDRLPQDVLVPVVRAMSAKKMAEVLAAMTPETAEKLTVALARRDRAGEPEARTAAAPGLPAGELPAIALPPRPKGAEARHEVNGALDGPA